MFALSAHRLSASFRAVVVLLVVGLTAVIGAPATAKTPQVTLYVGDRFTYEAIDPTTLTDDPSLPDVEFDPVESDGAPIISADGSTLILTAPGGEIIVRDGITGDERVRFDTHGTGLPMALSADGSRLVIYVGLDLSDRNLHPPAWKVFDTRSGKLVAAVQGSEPGCCAEAVDAGATRLYQLTGVGAAPDLAQRTGPAPARVIAYDLTTGEEIGRLDLPEIELGTWQSGEKFGGDADTEGYPVMKSLSPGLAVSPDGKQLAIAHADTDALTLVATDTLTVARTVALPTPRSVTSRLLSLLPLVPQSAAAKAMEGTQRTAVFSVDGDHLYLTGTATEITDGQMVMHGLGIQVVAIDSGEIKAAALAGVDVSQIRTLPDGSSLYVTARGDEQTGQLMWRLWRLDARTLDVQAERTYAGFRWMLLSPSPVSPPA